MARGKQCSRCGALNAMSARYCGRCGAELPASSGSPRILVVSGVVVLLVLAGAVVYLAAGYTLRQLATRLERESTQVGSDVPSPTAPVLEAVIVPSATATATARVGEELALATPTLAPSKTPSPTPVPSVTPAAAVTASDSPAASPTATSNPVSAPLFSRDVIARQRAVPPVVDGVLQEWENEAVYAAAEHIYQDPAWDGSEDLMTLWQLGWDQANLYIAVRVEDDVHVQTQGDTQIYQGDSLELQVDTDLTGDAGVTHLSPDDYQLIFSPGNFADLPSVVFRFSASEGGQIREVPGHRIALAARPSPTGYALEAAIPWSDLAVSPFPGLTLGFTLGANDNDTPGTARQEVLVSNVATRVLTDPTSWGTLTLQSEEAMREEPRAAYVTRLDQEITSALTKYIDRDNRGEAPVP